MLSSDEEYLDGFGILGFGRWDEWNMQNMRARVFGLVRKQVRRVIKVGHK